jgi:glycosyltransferase involved in cell wall biosynthesis
MKPNIAIYLQHYLSPSMTFIYRQILGVRNVVNPLVFSSHKVENMNLFPFDKIYFKKRDLLKVKTSGLFTKLYGRHKLLARKPKISYNQKRYFTKKMSNDDIKIIHAHFGPSGIEILPVAKHLNIPLIVSFHGYDGSILLKFEDYKRKLKRLFEYSYVIVPSHYMLEELNEKIGNINNYSIVNYGIPLDDFRYIERTSVKKKVDSGETLTFLQVSNFVEKKGHFYTVSAFRELLNFYSNAQLILAGDGYLKGEIQELVNNLGLTKKVIFPGAVNHNQVSIFMSKADLFLHHSITSSQGDKEGIPNVIMEAMSTGLPCISTKHAGIPELIKDEVNGLLVAERDIKGYVQKMKKLLATENDFNAQARKTIENDFNLEIQVKKLKTIYSGLIQNKYS